MTQGKVLTHSALVGAKPKNKPYKLSDTDRLYVLVSTTGKKYWKWNYRLNGKDSTYTLGTFPEMGLSAAREARTNAEKIVKNGAHPAEYLQEQILQSQANQAFTFWVVAEEWINKNRDKWSKGYLSQIENTLHLYVRDGPFGNRPIKQINTHEVYELINSLAKRTERRNNERKASGAPTLAKNLRIWVSSIFRLAISSGRATRNPVADMKFSDVISCPPVKNNRALTASELNDFLKALSKVRGQRSTGIAIELLLLTFVRTVELRGATWKEFDLEKKMWEIPASRMKIKTSGNHFVPLSDKAVKLLRELKEVTGVQLAGEKWIFPNNRDPSKCMSATTINHSLARMGFNGPNTIGLSAHGFRGTASTILHELGYRPEVIEAQLAHKERNTVKAAYNKAKYMNERIVMMQDWSNYLDNPAMLLEKLSSTT